MSLHITDAFKCVCAIGCFRVDTSAKHLHVRFTVQNCITLTIFYLQDFSYDNTVSELIALVQLQLKLCMERRLRPALIMVNKSIATC